MDTLDQYIQDGILSQDFTALLNLSSKDSAKAEFCITRTIGLACEASDKYSKSILQLFKGKHKSLFSPILYLSKKDDKVTYLEYCLLIDKLWLLFNSEIIENPATFVSTLSSIMQKERSVVDVAPTEFKKLLLMQVEIADESTSLLFWLSGRKDSIVIFSALFSHQSLDLKDIFKELFRIDNRTISKGLCGFSNLCYPFFKSIINKMFSHKDFLGCDHTLLVNALLHRPTVPYAEGESGLYNLIRSSEGMQCIKRLLLNNRELLKQHFVLLEQAMFQRVVGALTPNITVFNQLLKSEKGRGIILILFFQQSQLLYLFLDQKQNCVQNTLLALIQVDQERFCHFLGAGEAMFAETPNHKSAFITLCVSAPKILLEIAVLKSILYMAKPRMIMNQLICHKAGQEPTLAQLCKTRDGRRFFYWLVSHVEGLIQESDYAEIFEILIQFRQDNAPLLSLLAMDDIDDDDAEGVLDLLAIEHCALFMENVHRFSQALLYKEGAADTVLIAKMQNKDDVRKNKIFLTKVFHFSPNLLIYMVAYDAESLQYVTYTQNPDIALYFRQIDDKTARPMYVSAFCEVMIEVSTQKTEKSILYLWLHHPNTRQGFMYLIETSGAMFLPYAETFLAALTDGQGPEREGHSILLSLTGEYEGLVLLRYLAFHSNTLFGHESILELIVQSLLYVTVNEGITLGVTKIATEESLSAELLVLLIDYADIFEKNIVEFSAALFMKDYNNLTAVSRMAKHDRGRDLLFFLYFQYPAAMLPYKEQMVSYLLTEEKQSPGHISDLLSHCCENINYQGNTFILALTRYNISLDLLLNLSKHCFLLTKRFFRSICMYASNTAVNAGESVLANISQSEEGCNILQAIVSLSPDLLKKHSPVLSNALTEPLGEEGNIREHLIKHDAGVSLVSLIERASLDSAVNEVEAFGSV